MIQRAALLLLLLIAAMWTASAGDVPSIPLCGRIMGFAGDVNNKVSIKVDKPVNIDEAIVIAARPVPFDPTAALPYANDLTVNVTFLSRGLPFFALSDQYGVAYVADKTFTGEMLVTVRKRPQAADSVPFELYSYQMNMRECSVELSPTKPFIGPIPTHVPPQDMKVASFYLVASPPLGVEAFVLITAGTAASVFYSQSQTERGVPLVSGKACPWRVGDIYFTLVPKEDVTVAEMTRVSISYQTTATPSPPASLPQPSPAQPKPPNQSPVAPAPNQPAPDVNAPVAPTAAPHIYSPITNAASGSWSGFGLFIVAVLAYFSVRTIYNYRVEGITTFPEYIPHHETLAGFGSCLGTLASHVKNKGRQVAYSRSGYNAVNRQDIYDTHE